MSYHHAIAYYEVFLHWHLRLTAEFIVMTIEMLFVHTITNRYLLSNHRIDEYVLNITYLDKCKLKLNTSYVIII